MNKYELDQPQTTRERHRETGPGTAKVKNINRQKCDLVKNDTDGIYWQNQKLYLQKLQLAIQSVCLQSQIYSRVNTFSFFQIALPVSLNTL